MRIPYNNLDGAIGEASLFELPEDILDRYETRTLRRACALLRLSGRYFEAIRLADVLKDIPRLMASSSITRMMNMAKGSAKGSHLREEYVRQADAWARFIAWRWGF